MISFLVGLLQTLLQKLVYDFIFKVLVGYSFLQDYNSILGGGHLRELDQYGESTCHPLYNYATKYISTHVASDKSSLCACIFIFEKGIIDMVMRYIQNNLIAPNAMSFTWKFIFFVKLIRWF